MLSLFDLVLRKLFTGKITHVTGDLRIHFQPPDEMWRKKVSEFTSIGLNIYLADIRENNELRSNECIRHDQNAGQVQEIFAPRHIDCHYLITAWNSATESEAIESTIDEHSLLYEVTRVLMQSDPISFQQVVDVISDQTERKVWIDQLQKIYGKDLKEAHMPVQVLPAEGFPKYAEFWGSMGAGSRWKPAIYLIVTLPVLLPARPAGEVVTSHLIHLKTVSDN